MFVGSDIHAFVMHDSTPKFPIFSGRDIYLPISRIQKINTGRKELKKNKKKKPCFNSGCAFKTQNVHRTKQNSLLISTTTVSLHSINRTRTHTDEKKDAI